MFKKIKEKIICKYILIRNDIITWCILILKEHVQYHILVAYYLGGYTLSKISEDTYGISDRCLTNKIQRFINLYPSMDMKKRCRGAVVIKNGLSFKLKLILAKFLIRILVRSGRLEFDPLYGI